MYRITMTFLYPLLIWLKLSQTRTGANFSRGTVGGAPRLGTAHSIPEAYYVNVLVLALLHLSSKTQL